MLTYVMQVLATHPELIDDPQGYSYADVCWRMLTYVVQVLATHPELIDDPQGILENAGAF
jgi:hypothetical protein